MLIDAGWAAHYCGSTEYVIQRHLSDPDLNHSGQLTDDRSSTNLPKP
jgi:hypothetical protein